VQASEGVIAEGTWKPKREDTKLRDTNEEKGQDHCFSIDISRLFSKPANECTRYDSARSSSETSVASSASTTSSSSSSFGGALNRFSLAVDVDTTEDIYDGASLSKIGLGRRRRFGAVYGVSVQSSSVPGDTWELASEDLALPRYTADDEEALPAYE